MQRVYPFSRKKRRVHAEVFPQCPDLESVSGLCLRTSKHSSLASVELKISALGNCGGISQVENCQLSKVVHGMYLISNAEVNRRTVLHLDWNVKALPRLTRADNHDAIVASNVQLE